MTGRHGQLSPTDNMGNKVNQRIVGGGGSLHLGGLIQELEFMNDINELRWSNVDAAAANQLTLATNSPGVVHPIASTALSAQLQKMNGVSSYYVSGFVAPQAVSVGLTIGGEMVVARSHGSLTKNYNYVLPRHRMGQCALPVHSKALAIMFSRVRR